MLLLLWINSEISHGCSVGGRLTWMSPARVVTITATWTLLLSRSSTLMASDALDPVALIFIYMLSGASLTATPPIIRLMTAKVPAGHRHKHSAMIEVKADVKYNVLSNPAQKLQTCACTGLYSHHPCDGKGRPASHLKSSPIISSRSLSEGTVIISTAT